MSFGPFVEFRSNVPNSPWNTGLGTPLMTLRCDNDTASLFTESGMIQRWGDPLEALQWMSQNFGGDGERRWVGYLSYELGAHFEGAGKKRRDPTDIPSFIFSLHEAGTHKSTEAPQQKLFSQSLRSCLNPAQYLQKVRQCIEYIRAGDVFQINLSQQFVSGLTCQPIQIWERMNRNSPAAWGAYLDYGDFAIISNSPELFLKIEPRHGSRRRVITRPIKGTRPIGEGMREELLHSAKDQAELHMIVDLERNDLGRVCEIGSVKVTEPRVIEKHSTVYHGVATIEGELREDVGFMDLLRAVFPGGSITGAPKIRAMEIIEELEPVPRGVYCGAIGYLASDGSMQFNVAIRTMMIRNGMVHISVGGGVVADSDPAQEYAETLVKARAMFDALGISQTEIAAVTNPRV